MNEMTERERMWYSYFLQVLNRIDESNGTITEKKKRITEMLKALEANINDFYKSLTVFTIVLNHQIWQHYEYQNQALCEMYDSLWRKADNFCCRNFKGEMAEYYYRLTD